MKQRDRLKLLLEVAPVIATALPQLSHLLGGSHHSDEKPAGPSQDVQLKEWDEARDVCKTVDDLLMKIRTFALPLIATLVGTGSAVFYTGVPAITFPWEATLVLTLSFAVLALGGLALACVLPVSRRLKVRLWEAGFLLLVPASFVAWAIVLVGEKPANFRFPVPILISGGVVLFLIYLLDRLYYSSLLLGAVERAETLEKQLKMEITSSISRAARPLTYTLLPALIYLIPTLILINLGMAVAAFTAK